MKDTWHHRYISGAYKKQNTNDYIVFYYNENTYIKPIYNKEHTEVMYYEAYLLPNCIHKTKLIGKYNKLSSAKEACYKAE